MHSRSLARAIEPGRAVTATRQRRRNTDATVFPPCGQSGPPTVPEHALLSRPYLPLLRIDGCGKAIRRPTLADAPELARRLLCRTEPSDCGGGNRTRNNSVLLRLFVSSLKKGKTHDNATRSRHGSNNDVRFGGIRRLLHHSRK